MGDSGVGCFYKHFASTWLRRVGVTHQFFNGTPTSNFKTDFQFCLRLTNQNLPNTDELAQLSGKGSIAIFCTLQFGNRRPPESLCYFRVSFFPRNLAVLNPSVEIGIASFALFLVFP